MRFREQAQEGKPCDCMGFQIRLIKNIRLGFQSQKQLKIPRMEGKKNETADLEDQLTKCVLQIFVFKPEFAWVNVPRKCMVCLCQICYLGTHIKLRRTPVFWSKNILSFKGPRQMTVFNLARKERQKCSAFVKKKTQIGLRGPIS